MALRDKLAERAQPYLEPGERIEAIFPAQSGPSPYWILLSAWITIIGNRYVIIAVTDRAVVVLQAGRFKATTPKAVAQRLPRAVWLGRPGGLWGQIQLDQRYWVHRRFHSDVAAADAALASRSAPPPPAGAALPGYPPPAPPGYPQQPAS